MEIKNHKEAGEIFAKYRGGEFDYHGGPFDRGSADSYYRRPRMAHKWPDGTHVGEMVTDLTEAEKAAYDAGYAWNEWQGDHKDWGGEYDAVEWNYEDDDYD